MNIVFIIFYDLIGIELLYYSFLLAIVIQIVYMTFFPGGVYAMCPFVRPRGKLSDGATREKYAASAALYGEED